MDAPADTRADTTPPETSDADAPTRKGAGRLARLPRQLLRRTPFEGDIHPTRVPLFSLAGRPTAPFPHPWNYRDPIRILETYFWNADREEGDGRHNRYLDVPGFAPVFVTRDPGVIRAISTMTSDRPGHFDRDTLPTAGIARATGTETLLYANGPAWKRQKKISTPPFARTTLFQPEQFHEFEATFRATIAHRLEALARLETADNAPVRIDLEPEIKAVMLEMLVNNFFGADVAWPEIRDRYVPALDRVIDHIVTDTVLTRVGLPTSLLAPFSRRLRAVDDARADFERLTDLALKGRAEGRGLWKQFKSDAPDEALRGNIRVFLAGALEATTSYAGWAIAHLARHEVARNQIAHEVAHIDAYTPEALNGARTFLNALNETLRLTPSLYFHPRRATADTWIETPTGRRLHIPAGTHILLDIWHANRHDDHWGPERTGFPASTFEPARWDWIEEHEIDMRELLHFGFGHGPRFCPGKHLGQLEVALVVGAFVKLFDFRAISSDNPHRAGVSTKPGDGVHLELARRTTPPGPPPDAPSESGPGCPWHTS